MNPSLYFEALNLVPTHSALGAPTTVMGTSRMADVISSIRMTDDPVEHANTATASSRENNYVDSIKKLSAVASAGFYFYSDPSANAVGTPLRGVKHCNKKHIIWHTFCRFRNHV